MFSCKQKCVASAPTKKTSPGQRAADASNWYRSHNSMSLARNSTAYWILLNDVGRESWLGNCGGGCALTALRSRNAVWLQRWYIVYILMYKYIEKHASKNSTTTTTGLTSIVYAWIARKSWRRWSHEMQQQNQKCVNKQGVNNKALLLSDKNNNYNNNKCKLTKKIVQKCTKRKNNRKYLLSVLCQQFSFIYFTFEAIFLFFFW